MLLFEVETKILVKIIHKLMPNIILQYCLSKVHLCKPIQSQKSVSFLKMFYFLFNQNDVG